MCPSGNPGKEVVRDDLAGVDELFVIVCSAGIDRDEHDWRRVEWQRMLALQRDAIDPYLKGDVVVGDADLPTQMGNQASLVGLDCRRQEGLQVCGRWDWYLVWMT